MEVDRRISLPSSGLTLGSLYGFIHGLRTEEDAPADASVYYDDDEYRLIISWTETVSG